MSALTRCLEEEAAAIAAAAQRLPAHQVDAALALLDACVGKRAKLVITGVGKSGIVARKIAATFSSIGLMAIYLNPVDALHGDLGVVAPDDLALLLSNSGETEELLAILPHLKRRGTPCMALVGRTESSLARGCAVVLDGSVDREVCPLNLAPRRARRWPWRSVMPWRRCGWSGVASRQRILPLTIRLAPSASSSPSPLPI